MSALGKSLVLVRTTSMIQGEKTRTVYEGEPSESSEIKVMHSQSLAAHSERGPRCKDIGEYTVQGQGGGNDGTGQSIEQDA